MKATCSVLEQYVGEYAYINSGATRPNIMPQQQLTFINFHDGRLAFFARTWNMGIRQAVCLMLACMNLYLTNG